MKNRQSALKIATALGLAALLTTQASAGPWRRPIIVVTPGAYPAYPVVTGYGAPVSTVVSAPVETVYGTSTVVSAPRVYAAPLIDPALVPTTYTSTSVVSTPVVSPSPYASPAIVGPAPRVRMVYPRRVYRYGY